MKKILMFLLLVLNISVPLVFSESTFKTLFKNPYNPGYEEEECYAGGTPSISYSIAAAVDGYGKAWAKVRNAAYQTIDEVSIPLGLHDDDEVYHSGNNNTIEEIRAYCRYDSLGDIQKRSYANATCYW